MIILLNITIMMSLKLLHQLFSKLRWKCIFALYSIICIVVLFQDILKADWWIIMHWHIRIYSSVCTQLVWKHDFENQLTYSVSFNQISLQMTRLCLSQRYLNLSHWCTFAFFQISYLDHYLNCWSESLSNLQTHWFCFWRWLKNCSDSQMQLIKWNLNQKLNWFVRILRSQETVSDSSFLNVFSFVSV